jgi:hypothetical protein
MREFDSELVFGTRPTLSVVRQPDLLRLPDRGDAGTDFVLLEFDPRAVSSVQRQALLDWVSAGHGRVLLVGTDLSTYGPLLGIHVRRYELPAASPAKTADLRVVATSPVAADAMRVAVRARAVGPGTYPGDCSVYWDAVHTGETPDVTAVAMYADRLAAAGVCKVGNGQVYFFPGGKLVRGDAERFRLNFLQWALGLAVPASALPMPVTSRTVRVEVIETTESADLVIKTNGDVVHGTVLDASFALETRDGRLDFRTGRLDRVDFRYGEGEADVVTLRGGSRFSGRVQNDPISVRLPSGETVEIGRRRIREILFRPVRQAPPSDAP